MNEQTAEGTTPPAPDPSEGEITAATETPDAVEAAAPASLADADADQLAALVAGASDDQLAEGIAGENRKQVLDDIFRRMADHTEPSKIQGVSAVIHWHIGAPPEGADDRYEVVISDGDVQVSDSPSRDPRVTLKVGSVDFLRLVSGAQAGPTLFMAGKLRIEGDLMFATQVATFFRIPKAAQS